MEKTLSNGDIIFVEKLSYGPKIPNNLSEVPFGNIFFKNMGVIENYKYARLTGLNEIKRNDIITFKKSNESRTYVKRIIGLPGDQLKIINSKVFINESIIKENDNYTFEYNFINNKERRNSILLSNKEYKTANNEDSLVKLISKPNSKLDDIFPKEKLFEWNLDNYGGVWIPKKGESIKLTNESIIFYKEIIETEIGVEIKNIENSDEYYIGNNKIESYTFHNNYYFVMGDNRHFSKDSRAIGFISEDFIVGKFWIKF